MAKDFNIYQWRRNHLNENQVSEKKKSWKEDFEEMMKTNNLTPIEVMDYLENYFKDEKGKPSVIGLNEEEITKTVGDLTWDDVAGLSLPTGDAGVQMYMDNRDMFSDDWREKTLKNWKDSLTRQFPEAMSFKVVIDRSLPSYDRVKILNKDYMDTISRRSAAQQAEFDKYRKRN